MKTALAFGLFMLLSTSTVFASIGAIEVTGTVVRFDESIVVVKQTDGKKFAVPRAYYNSAVKTGQLATTQKINLDQLGKIKEVE